MRATILSAGQRKKHIQYEGSQCKHSESVSKSELSSRFRFSQVLPVLSETSVHYECIAAEAWSSNTHLTKTRRCARGCVRECLRERVHVTARRMIGVHGIFHSKDMPIIDCIIASRRAIFDLQRDCIMATMPTSVRESGSPSDVSPICCMSDSMTIRRLACRLRQRVWSCTRQRAWREYYFCMKKSSISKG